MIIIAAAIITDSQGRCLLVRKRGTEYFMQPGGKPEIGETPHAALIRELEEELNFSVSPEELVQVAVSLMRRQTSQVILSLRMSF